MQTIAQDNSFVGTILTSHAGSRRRLWAGRVLSWLAVLFLLFDSAGKLLQVQPVIDGTIQLGYPNAPLPVIDPAAALSWLTQE